MKTLQKYPKQQATDSRSKVSIYFYADEADAFDASNSARYNGRILEREGYDFGYMAPGAMTQVKDDYSVDSINVKGMWSVVIP